MTKTLGKLLGALSNEVAKEVDFEAQPEPFDWIETTTPCNSRNLSGPIRCLKWKHLHWMIQFTASRSTPLVA